MKRIINLTMLIVLICGVSFQNIYSQAATITGKVTDNAGEGLISCSVILLNLQGNIVAGTATDEKGDYAIANVSRDIYIIKAEYLGFATQSQRIEITSESSQNFDIKLPESSLKLDEIIISGRKAEKISESSANIQVIDSKTIAVTQESTTYGLLQNISGIDYIETGLGQQQVNARGFSSPFVGTMLTLVDNRPVSLPGLGADFGSAIDVTQLDIKRIEVIVGPNSALYGANASHGVINIITKNPKEYAGTSIVLKGGNRYQLGSSFRSSGLLGKKFGYKIGGEVFTADDFDQKVELILKGQPTGTYTNPDNKIQRSNINGSFYFFPNNKIELLYTGGVSFSNFVNQSNIGAIQIDGLRYWYHQIRANISNFLNFGSAFYQVNYSADDLGNTYKLIDVAKLVASGTDETLAKHQYKLVENSQRLDMEFQHNFDLGKQNFVTWGLQYRNTLPKTNGTILSDGPTGEKIKVNEYGCYLQYDNEMINNFKLTLSGRYDNNDVFGDQFSPKVALSYNNKNHNLRVVYNKAFSSPPLQPAFSALPLAVLQTNVEIDPVNNPGVLIPSVPVNMILRGANKGFTITDINGNQTGSIAKLAPSETSSYEFGYRGSFFEKLYIDITLYHTIYTNFMSSAIPINNPELVLDGSSVGAGLIHTGQGWASLALGSPATTPLANVAEYPNELILSYINFGKAEVNGIDVASEFYITSGLILKAAYSYTKYNDFEDVPSFITAPGTPNSPKNVWRGGLKYIDKKGVFAELSFRTVESYYFGGAQEYQRGQIPTFTVFNLNGEVPLKFIKFSKASFGVSLKNILNSKHIELPGTPKLGFLGIAYLRFDFNKK